MRNLKQVELEYVIDGLRAVKRRATELGYSAEDVTHMEALRIELQRMYQLRVFDNRNAS